MNVCESLLHPVLDNRTHAARYHIVRGVCITLIM